MKFNAVGLTAKNHETELIRAFDRVLRSGIFLNGPENQKLEAELQKKLGGGLVTMVASGHDALIISLLALHLKPTDEVIFPVNAYPTAFPVVLSGVKPVPVDVDENGQLDPRALEKAITKCTKAVVMVHLYGLVGEIGEVREICRKHTIVLIEDAAQAFGSTYQGRPVGTIGDIGCFSFYPTKNLGSLGDGGALWTRHKKWFEFFVKAKAYGEKNRYASELISGHSRLPELQAAALRVYLRYLDKEIKLRQKVFGWYKKSLHGVRILQSINHSFPVPHLLVIESDKRDALQHFLKSRGIETFIHYPQPVHLVPAFRSLGYGRGEFPIAERLAPRILSLPFHPFLTKKDVQTVVQSIRDFYHGEKNR